MIDIINEEEKQFLKTLGRGRRVFEKTIKTTAMETGVIPGGWVFTITVPSHLISKLSLCTSICYTNLPKLFRCCLSFSNMLL